MSELCALFMQNKHQRSELKKQFLLEDDELKEVSARIVQGIEQRMETGEHSRATEEGTVFWSQKSRIVCIDPEQFNRFITGNDPTLGMVNLTPNKDAMFVYQEQHGTMPPGIEELKSRSISVRKPTKVKI